jgi:cell division protein FtsQ
VRDMKSSKAINIRGNRFKKEKRPLAWRQLFGRLLRVTVGVISVALLTCGGVLTARMLLASNYFAVATVRVENQERLDEQEVLALSEIRRGTNIFDLDLDMIGRKIAENPWVASACVERVFPDEVMIRISERRPEAIVSLDYLYYVDGAGEIFKRLDSGDRLDFPLISGINRQLLLDRPEEARRQLAEALQLLKELNRRKVFGIDHVSEVNIDPTDGLTLYTCHGGVPVRLGRNGFGAKLDCLEGVFHELQPRLAAVAYIDLNVAERVIVKLDRKRIQGRG